MVSNGIDTLATIVGAPCIVSLGNSLEVGRTKKKKVVYFCRGGLNSQVNCFRDSIFDRGFARDGTDVKLYVTL